MKNDDEQSSLMLAVIGIIPVIWFALLVAPYLSSGLMGILEGVPEAMNHPFSIQLCGDSVKTVLIFLLSYGMGIGIYISTRKHYRRGEEHGSAKWGNVKKINRRYREKRFTKNKLLTMHVQISYNMRKHLRNVLTVVIGGSGSGKTRFFAKPNLMQANTSFVVLDPKGENLRDTGYLLEEKGYEIYATAGTATFLNAHGVNTTPVYWPDEKPDAENNVMKMIAEHKFDLIVNIPKNHTKRELTNGYKIRRGAIDHNIPLITNARLASAFIEAFCEMSEKDIQIKSWQDYK